MERVKRCPQKVALTSLSQWKSRVLKCLPELVRDNATWSETELYPAAQWAHGAARGWPCTGLQDSFAGTAVLLPPACVLPEESYWEGRDECLCCRQSPVRPVTGHTHRGLSCFLLAKYSFNGSIWNTLDLHHSSEWGVWAEQSHGLRWKQQPEPGTSQLNCNGISEQGNKATWPPSTHGMCFAKPKALMLTACSMCEIKALHAWPKALCFPGHQNGAFPRYDKFYLWQTQIRLFNVPCWLCLLSKQLLGGLSSIKKKGDAGIIIHGWRWEGEGKTVLR